MMLRTALTEMFGIEYPIVSAPMGGIAGGALAAAVSEAGGLGMIGGGRQIREWLDRECAIAADTEKPWGIGFLTWDLDLEILSHAIEHRPAAIMLSFGEPEPFAAAVRAAGIVLIVQVTSMDELARALDVEADVVVAQGGEAGGHGGGRGTLPFVPAAVDAAAPTPVLAAGGIADGRGLAAALVLGAAGALIGTRFEATHESLVQAEAAKAIVAARASETERNRVLDIARRSAWPAEYPARTLRNAFLEEWRGREAELDADPIALQRYRDAAERNDLDYVPVWAGEAVDLIAELEPAGDLVRRIGLEAEAAIARVARPHIT